jgi:hypothetical protein
MFNINVIYLSFEFYYFFSLNLNVSSLTLLKQKKDSKYHLLPLTCNRGQLALTKK